MKSTVKLAVYTWVVVAAHAWAADQNNANAIQYLDKMSKALQSLNYHGTLVYMRDGHVESLQLIHKKDGEGESERLVHLSGAAREVIRKNNTVTCYMPDRRSVLVGERRLNSHLLAKLTNNFANFAGNYTFDVEGEGRVAGKIAKIIFIKPRDDYRYGYRLWIDGQNGLLLKSDLLDVRDKVLEQMMFVKLDIVDFIPDDMLKPGVSGEKYTWHSAKDEAYKPKGSMSEGEFVHAQWTIENMPQGFAVSSRSKQRMPNSSMPAEHVVLSDGLATISVYIEEFSAESQPIVGASQMGAVNIYASILEDYQVTVVGEVPQTTVKMIARSVVLNQKSTNGAGKDSGG